MSKLLKYILYGIGVTLVTSISILYYNNKQLKKDLSTTTANMKAYVLENDTLKNQAGVFQLTINQLESYNDSILQKMNEVREGLGIKDKNLQAIQYIHTTSTRVDTVEFRDTIFRESTVHIDTLLGDEWYQLHMELIYPNTIVTTPTFKSEQYVVTSYSKETIKPAKKCWLLRLFQKKQKVVRVNIVEKNPYIETKQSKFVEIIK